MISAESLVTDAMRAISKRWSGMAKKRQIRNTAKVGRRGKGRVEEEKGTAIPMIKTTAREKGRASQGSSMEGVRAREDTKEDIKGGCPWTATI